MRDGTLFLSVFTTVLASIPSALSISTYPPCLAQYNWMDNSLGQNPCAVALYAQDVCGGDWSITKLQGSDFYYPGPNAASRNPCMCNTVTYSLFQACGICQNGTIATWGEWTSNCSTVPLSYDYPQTIPQNTSFPAWAYLPVNITGSFNVTAALADVSAPESTPPVQSTFAPSTMSSAGATPTSQSASLATSTTTVAPSPTQTATVGAVSHKSNAGPIAGGVVGGLAGLAIVAGIVAYFLMRRRRNAAPSVEPYGAKSQMTHTTNSPPPMSYQQQPYSPQPYRPYDPTDPSTFPPSAPTPTIQTSHSGYANGAQQPGRYSGMPEV